MDEENYTISRIIGGLLRIDKDKEHIWIHFPWTLSQFISQACLCPHVRSENDEVATICLTVKNMTSIRATTFNEDNRAPGLGTVGTNLVTCKHDDCDGLVYLHRFGQGLEAATDQGWHIGFSTLPSKPDHRS